MSSTFLRSRLLLQFLNHHLSIYRVLRAQADWTFILLSEFPLKELRHLPRKLLPRGITH
jgi:hypothetical protein